MVAGLRPEHLPAANGTAGPVLAGDVDPVEALGSELMVHVTIDARRVRAEGAASADEEAVTESGEGVARVDPARAVKVGERARFAIKADGMQFFDPDSQKSIWGAQLPGLPVPVAGPENVTFSGGAVSSRTKAPTGKGKNMRVFVTGAKQR